MSHQSSPQMRTPLGKARGLGSAHHGAHHWWAQRLTAIALVPLCLWFLFLAFDIAAITDQKMAYGLARQTIAAPWNTALAILLVIALFHHIQLGMQIVVEDYVHNTTTKFFSLILLKLLCISLATICLLAILSIAFLSS